LFLQRKMVRVKGVDFETYELDTPESFSQRVANEFGTVPKYLYFPNGLDNFSEVKEIDVKDILKKLKKNAKKSVDFSAFLNSIKPMLNKNINIERDILHVWLAYNKVMEKLPPDEIKKIGQQFVQKDYFPSDINFENFWNTREVVKNTLNNDILMNSEMVKIQTNIYNHLNEVEGIPSTDFKTDHVKLDIKLDLPDTSLLELFNYIVTGRQLPFATCKQYYKILKDFIPPDEWSESTDNLLLKVSEKEVVNPLKYDDYNNVLIRDENDILYASMKLSIIKGNVTREQFIDRLLSSFELSSPITYSEDRETETAGTFYYPQERINPYILSDLIMNDPLFSYLINTDESSRATKKKSDKSIPWLYIYFNHPIVGKITASITQKIVQWNDPVIKEADSEIFPIGSPYIRIRAKGRDRESIEIFRIILSKLFEIYAEKHNDISDIYQQYLPPKVFENYFGVEEEEVEEVDMNRLQNVAPEVFVKKYSRRCKKEKMPTAIPAERVEEFTSNGQQVMKFPRDRDETKQKYPSDGVNQHYYVCTNPVFPFPGLQKNTLANSEDYPYVPCCFTTDQTKKPIYQHYFGGKELKLDRGKTQQDLIKTDKILGPDKYGDLPEDLFRLFELIDPSPEYKYIRIGVKRDHSSFLHSVMLGMHDETNVLNLDEQEQDDLVNATRQELSSPSIAPVCRQSMYDSDMKTIISNIQDLNTYLDPNLYLQLLENKFDCNIYLFNRKRMVLPRHVQSYYSDKRLGRPCIFIYEHWGSESDHAKYPQCELIVRWKIHTTGTDYYFPYVQKVSRGVRMMFGIMRESYSLNNPIKLTEFPLQPISQYIDSNGKCRQVEIRTRKGSIFLFTSPIAPRKAQERETVNVVEISMKNALRLLSEYGTVTSQSVIGGKVKELVGTIGTVEVRIPVREADVIDELPILNITAYPDIKKSLITIYNENKKLTRYIVEYCYWLFSNYFQQQNSTIITDEIINDFALNHIDVDPTFVYPNIRKNFAYNGSVIRNNKLVVTSDEIMKRLIYVLRMYSIRNTYGLVNYHTKKVIQNYYEDITDFTQRRGEIIIYGERAIAKWLQENSDGLSYRFYDHIVVDSRLPYFFRNDIIGQDMYLAQNIDSLDKAISIAITWQKKGYNKSMYTEDRKSGEIEFVLYRYINSKNIKPFHVIGKKTKRPIRIIGYKIDNTPLYTVLLSLQF